MNIIEVAGTLNVRRAVRQSYKYLYSEPPSTRVSDASGRLIDLTLPRAGKQSIIDVNVGSDNVVLVPPWYASGEQFGLPGLFKGVEYLDLYEENERTTIPPIDLCIRISKPGPGPARQSHLVTASGLVYKICPPERQINTDSILDRTSTEVIFVNRVSSRGVAPLIKDTLRSYQDRQKDLRRMQS